MTGTSHKPTYPGVIPYRTNSPSSPTPAVLTDGPRLLNVVKTVSNDSSGAVNNNYNTLPVAPSGSHHHLQNGKRNNMAAITSTSLYSTGKRQNSKENLKKIYTEKEIKETLQDYTLTEDEVRDKYYAYWEQQRVSYDDK